tara:strand:- start:1251 stop:1442 length:192 start_codon:yes stop_codon:yes gene_type:complete
MTFSYYYYVDMLDLARHLAEQQVAQRLDKDLQNLFAFSMDLQILKLLVTLQRPLLVMHYPPGQ